MKVLLHAHSNWSHDGQLNLSEIAEIMLSEDLGAICMSEHEESGWDRHKYEEYRKECAKHSKRGRKIIPGIEFSCSGIHTLCYGLESYPTRPSSMSELKSEVNDQGCLLIYAHPRKYSFFRDKEYLKAIDGVEIWNSKFLYDWKVGPNDKTFDLLLDSHRLFIGQDIHTRKDLSGLLIETLGSDVLEDLRMENFNILYNNQHIVLSKNRLRSLFNSSYHQLLMVAISIKKRVRQIWS